MTGGLYCALVHRQCCRARLRGSGQTCSKAGLRPELGCLLSSCHLLPCLSAMATMRSGLKVPSVSMYIALPSAPPMPTGICARRTQQSALLTVSGSCTSGSTGDLAGDAQRVAQLRLAAAILAIDLGDGPCLHATCSQAQVSRCGLSPAASQVAAIMTHPREWSQAPCSPCLSESCLVAALPPWWPS